MKPLLRTAVLTAFVMTGVYGCARTDQALPVSAAEFVERHPERTDRLLDSLDLTLPELRPVRLALADGDRVAAAGALLAHYRTSGNGAWLRERVDVHDPGGFDQDVEKLADDTLADVYLLQGVRGKARRTATGVLDWTWQGPEDDVEWALFMNRHFILLPLLKAYARTGNNDYIQYVNKFLMEWTDANFPPVDGADEFAMPPPWQPMSTASRLLQVWPQLFYYLQDEAAFSDAARLTMLSTIADQADHLQRYHRQKHNHAVKEMAGLGHAAAAWPEFRAARQWTEYSVATLGEEIERQVYPTGVQKELSSHYQRTVLEYVAQYAAFSAAAGIELPRAFMALAESMGRLSREDHDACRAYRPQQRRRSRLRAQ